MKMLKVIFTLLLIIFISAIVFAQDINVHNTIGQKRSEVVKKYGKPVHQDASNPSMVCSFYQGPNNNFTFVSDDEGVFQAEAWTTYSDRDKALSVFNSILSSSKADQYEIDSVTAVDYRIHKPGVKADLQFSENKLSNKYDIRLKAVRVSK